MVMSEKMVTDEYYYEVINITTGKQHIELLDINSYIDLIPGDIYH